MTSLPEPFPIRYSIYIRERFGKKVPQEVRDVLKNKLIILLQNKPLTLDDLAWDYGQFWYSFDGIDLCHLVELGKDQKWADAIQKDLEKHLLEGTFSSGFGTAFSLGIISYKGTLEIPLFWKIHASYEQPRIKHFIRQEGYVAPQGISKQIERTYNKILSGDTGWLERKKTMNKNSVFELTIPYSKLWASLDNYQSDGFIGSLQDEADISFNKKAKDTFEDGPEKVKVVCSWDFESLIQEEMLAVYNEVSFCKNCGKALPFGTKNKYCPDTPENKECVRKRATIRKKKKRKN